MRNMSFFHTQEQYLDGSKTETTRKGWANLKPGEKFMGIEKGQGLKKGKKVKRLGPSITLKNEPIKINTNYYTQANVDAEGFPGLTPEEFINDILIAKCGFDPDGPGYRITFKRIE